MPFIESSLPPSLAFLSYCRFNDKADQGGISAFCNDLSDEVKVQTGLEFPIFQDNNHIHWGENWQARIDGALASSTFLLPILTPGFFRSKHCLYELEKFLEYEEGCGRKDLVLPVIYVSGNEKGVYQHPLEKVILTRQCVDWTELRFADRNQGARRNKLAELAKQIRSAIIRTNSYQHNRENSEPFFVPRRLKSGKENEPLGRVLGMVDNQEVKPQQLLNSAMHSKQQGQYGEAKSLHDQLIAMPIQWNRHPDFFIDLLYFSISLHDKLEYWSELDILERVFFIPQLARIESLMSASALLSVRTLYGASMALSMLRQTRLEEASNRINNVLKYPQTSDNDASEQLILYANALVTRALICHSSYIYGGDSLEQLLAAHADINAAEMIYREHAKMGDIDEFHHVGRIYGARTFLTIALCEVQENSLLVFEQTLLQDAHRAHEGKNRTNYGRIAGMYCHAHCLFQIASHLEEGRVRIDYLIKAYQLLRDAMGMFNSSVSLGRYKVASLTQVIIKAIGETDELAAHLPHVEKEQSKALNILREKGFQYLERIMQPQWLYTPLN